MKRIEFIAPVEAMRGNLSGNQELKYAKRNNPAWDAPEGLQAAKNYTTRFVGAKRSRDGLKYFSVRTKGVVNLTVKAREQMALLAGSAACYLAASKTLSILTQLQQAFHEAKQTNPNLTFRKWLQGYMYEMLANKMSTIAIPSSSGDVKIDNPWVPTGGTGTDLSIPSDILVKFWTELSVDGFNFTLVAAGGIRVKGIAFSGLNWETLADDGGSAYYNVLGLYIDHEDNDALKYKGLFVWTPEGDDIVDTASAIAPAEYPVHL